MTLWLDKRYSTYRYIWRENGKQRMKSLGKDRKVAEIKTRELDRKRDLGELAPIMIRTTIEEHLKWFLKYHLSGKRKKTIRSYKYCLKLIIQYFANQSISYLDQITSSVWEQLEHNLLKHYSIETRNDIFAVLSVFVNTAIRKNRLFKSPLIGIKRRLKNPNKRLPKIYSDDEITQLRKHANITFRSIIDIILLTGIRRGEACVLEWNDVDLKENTLTIQAKPDLGFTPKDYTIRTINLPDQALKILNDLDNRNKYIFENAEGQPIYKPSSLAHRFAAIRKKAGIDEGSLHSLRRTYATRLLSTGASIRYIQQQLGHESIRTTERYLNPDVEYNKKLAFNLKYNPLKH